MKNLRISNGVIDCDSVSKTQSVSGAIAFAKEALESVVVRLVGEVSEVSCKPGYKAAYFTVKDKSAALPCMMWNNRYEVSGVQLRVGQLVELTGRFTVYAPKGRMNFDVFSIALAGEGVLRQQVADLARKLEAEGLMQPARKRPLLSIPATVGLVTSPRGAAVHDVLRTLRRRFPLAKVLVAGVPVEGRGAAARIIEGIACVSKAGAEVVLVVRGGGSFEDMMPFNDESLARAISACSVPVVTGIGHEPDTSIADMVSDLRASTPTAAAEAVAPDCESLKNLLDIQAKTLCDNLDRRLEREQAAVQRFAERPVFRDSVYLFAVEAQMLDYASERLVRVLPAYLAQEHERIKAFFDRMRVVLPHGVQRDCRVTEIARERLMRALPLMVGREQTHLGAVRDRMKLRSGTIVPRFKSETALCAARLHDLSPLAILGRGYAVARDAEGQVVKHIQQAPVGSDIEVSVSDGTLTCCVIDASRIETSVESWEELI